MIDTHTQPSLREVAHQRMRLPALASRRPSATRNLQQHRRGFSSTRRDARARSGPLPIAGGLALVAAAMAKLFLFDLGTLDGIFRVVVFIVVGLVLLGMGAGYARLLEKQDQQV